MNIALHGLHALAFVFIFLFIIRRADFFKMESVPLWWFHSVFVLKATCGTALWALYTYYYTDRATADIYKYFDDGMIMATALRDSPLDYFRMLTGIGAAGSELTKYYHAMSNWYRPLEPELFIDNRTIIRFNALAGIFSFGNIHVHTIIMSFFSFVGLTGIMKSFLPYAAGKTKLLFAVIFLAPSVLFWGSGLLKEGIMIFALGMSVWYFFQMLTAEFRPWVLIKLSIVLFLLALIKVYVFLLLFPCLAAALFVHFSGNRYAVAKYILILSALAAAFIYIPYYTKGIVMYEMLTAKQMGFVELAAGSYVLENDTITVGLKYSEREKLIPAGRDGFYTIKKGTELIVNDKKDPLMLRSKTVIENDTAVYHLLYFNEPARSRIEIPMLEKNLWSFVKNSPAAFRNVLLRPYPWEVSGLLLIPAALENMMLVFFMLLSVIFMKRDKNFPVITFCLAFTVLVFCLTGLITPVLGAIVRYKIAALPFLLVALVLILDKDKLSGFLMEMKRKYF